MSDRDKSIHFFEKSLNFLSGNVDSMSVRSVALILYWTLSHDISAMEQDIKGRIQVIILHHLKPNGPNLKHIIP